MAIQDAPIFGSKLYQRRARVAMPILVRQAHAGQPITYTDIAAEMGVPNPRNYDYILEAVGRSLQQLAQVWGQEIPPLETLVVQKNTRMPGSGWYLLHGMKESDFTNKQRRALVASDHQKAYAYPHWHKVLETFELLPVQEDFSGVLERAGSTSYGGGESERHKALKHYISTNPALIGLNSHAKEGETEYPLLSGDRLDVSFIGRLTWVAAEVKTRLSPESDIIRGIFQCVKYRAVMQAQVTLGKSAREPRAVLALEGAIPESLVAMKNTLGVEVIEGIRLPSYYQLPPAETLE